LPALAVLADVPSAGLAFFAPVLLADVLFAAAGLAFLAGASLAASAFLVAVLFAAVVLVLDLLGIVVLLFRSQDGCWGNQTF
jgi:hypothetical protein